MKSLDFPGAILKIGATQTDIYNVIHAYPLDGPEKEVIAIFELSDEERAEVAQTGKIYYSRLTFGALFQPMKISAYPIEFVMRFNDENWEPVKGDHKAYITSNGPEVEGFVKYGDTFKKIEE